MRTFVLSLVTSLALFSAGCSLNTDYFSEYRGKNLLGNSGFATGKWTTSTVGLVAAAPTTDYYMTWEKVGTGATDAAYDTAASTPVTGPDGSAAYRLEIKNLIPDGDFETETNGATTLFYSTNAPVFWTAVAAGISPTMTVVSNDTTNNGSPQYYELLTTLTNISNQSLLFSDQNSGDTLVLDLGTALGTLWLPNDYRFRMDFINASQRNTFNISMTAGANTLYPSEASSSGVWNQLNLTSILTGEPVVDVSQDFTVTAGRTFTRQVVLGGNQNAALIDNVRLLLASQELSAGLSFTSLSSGSLTLLPGVQSGAYVFSIEVQDDPTANQAAGTGKHFPDRMEPSGLTITVKGYANNTGLTVLAQKFFARPAGGWSSWQLLSVPGGLDFVSSDAALGGNPALVVQLSPTNEVDISTGGKDTGSLLVASPTLTYNP